MKRIFASIVIFLYLYNIAGYLATFSVLQYRVRNEVKKMLRASVPQGELITLTFHTLSREKGIYPLQWIEDHEFRYNGSMYDILRSHVIGDSTYYVCINDVQEEQLFADLENHVQRHMGDSGQPGKFDSFKDVFKDSYARCSVTFTTLPSTEIIDSFSISEYLSIDPDVPFLPPRAV